MSTATLLILCAIHSIGFALFHLGFWRLFGWPRTLQATTLPNRAIVQIANVQLVWVFAGVGLLQSALICAGDLYFLGVQCANPALFFLVGWLASFVFVNIIYALTASFGDVGKAIAVVLMVIQVAGSGGTAVLANQTAAELQGYLADIVEAAAAQG